MARRFRFVIALLVSVTLVLSAAGPDVCDAAAPPVAPHAADHATEAHTGCPPSAQPAGGSGESFGLVSLYFLPCASFPPISLVSLSPDPMPPEA